MMTRHAAMRLVRRVGDAESGSIAEKPSTFDIARQVFRLIPGSRSFTALLVAIGVVASLAESLGVTLLILFLYAVMAPHGGEIQQFGLIKSVLETIDIWAGGDKVVIAALLVAMIVAKFMLSLLNGILATRFTNRISERTRNDIFAQILDMSYADATRYDRGELLNTMATESFSVAGVLNGVVRVAVHLASSIVFAAVLIATCWQIALIAIGGIVVYALAMKQFSRPIRRIGAGLARSNQAMTDLMLATLQGMRTIRVFARERMQKRRFRTASRAVRTHLDRAETISHLVGTTSEFLTLSILAAVVMAAAPLGLPFASVLASMALIYRLQPHLREIDRQRLNMHELFAPLELVRQLLDRTDKTYPTPGSRPYSGINVGISFRDVDVTYASGARPALNGASFDIKAGAHTAIVGPSGAGKTTIINLLLRLVEPSAGTIAVDGVALLELRRGDWLKRIAVSGQDVELIEGTVRDNIAMCHPDASDAEIAEVARLAGLADFIETLPNGYNEWIGDYGLNISGGQRQRVGLARAMIADPEILVLDEATSAIDGATESEIWHNIRQRFSGRTVVVVSHRLSATQTMDHVVRLSLDGRVIQEGDPKILLASCDTAFSRMVHDHEAIPLPKTA